LTNPTYQWRFRYNAGHTGDAYKWEYVGGTAYRAMEPTPVTIPAAWTLLGPVLVAPRGGVYRIVCGAHLFGDAGGTVQLAIAGGPIIGVTVGIGNDTKYVQAAGDVNVGAAAEICQATTSPSAISSRDRILDVVPVRVA
jgi:hypothetical protein